MKRPRITIARCLVWTAILAVNMALVRSFVVRRPLFEGGDLVFVPLQVGLWCLFRSRGRLRCFWAGFVVPSMAAFVVLLLFEPLLAGYRDEAGRNVRLRFMDRFMTPYTDFVDELEVTWK